MSTTKEEEADEFGVAWTSVDNEQLFSDDNQKMEDDIEDATHPSTLLTSGQSEDEEEEASSVEEGEESRNDGDLLLDEGGDSMHPSPYTPSQAKIGKSGVELLSPTTSRLASFTSDLRFRFSDTSDNTGVSSSEGGAMPLFPSEEGNDVAQVDDEEKEDVDAGAKEVEDDEDDDVFKEAPWPGDSEEDEPNGDDEIDAEADTDEEGEDDFAVDEKPKVIRGNQSSTRNTPLAKELSTTWMKFDDEKWESSKHDAVEGPLAITSSKNKPEADEGDKQATAATNTPATNTKKKKNGKLSLEAGLAKVSKDTKQESPAGPSEERKGGQQENEIISFWEEGTEGEEEASANDPLAIALKAKPAVERNNDSSVFKSPKSSSLSHFSSSQPSSRSSSLGKQQQQLPKQNQGPGWIQKGLGQALGLVASNLPFNKSQDDDDVTEDNVVEVDDMPFPNYTQTHGTVPVKPTSDNNGSMQDISAISDDSAFHGRKGGFQVPRQTLGPHDSSTTGEENSSSADGPTQALVAKAKEHKEIGEKGIKFAKEAKESKEFHAMPLYDIFMDLPHPAAATDVFSAPSVIIGAPTDSDEEIEIQNDIQDALEDITKLAFPEYDSSVVQESDEETSETRRFQKNPLETPGFQHYTFPFQLPSGRLTYAHVRRYLPLHKDSVFRYDVGRRLGRALVIFTRYPGGDDFFASVLRTLDAIRAQHSAMRNLHTVRPQKWFLQNLFQKHHRLCGHFATIFDDRRGAPHIITLQGLEFADCLEHYAIVDATHFFVQNDLLHVPLIPDMKVSFDCSILPVFRCLGVVNALRLLSALLCERCIVMVSVSPTRLDRTIRAALAMLAQGMLNWQHTCVPVLPPDFWSYLASPSPYLIGVLAPMAYRLELTDDLGEVVIFNLDEKSIKATGTEKLSKLVPDLCRNLSEAMIYKRRIPMPENIAREQDMASLSLLNSSSDFLAQDLVEICKSDKKTMNGTAVAAKHMAKKATKAVKSTLKYFLGGSGGEKTEEGEQEPEGVKKSKREKRMEPDAVFIEGCRNEAGEEAAKLAFVSFYLRILGNSEGYVQESEDSDFHFNKDTFLRQRRDRGDGQGTPMWNMLLNFCETKMVKEFVKVREDHIRKRQPPPIDAPLFWKCIDFLEMKNIDFGIINVRSVARMLHQKSSVQQMLPSNVRRLAMALTSKRKFEGHLKDAMTDLAELSRENSAALHDVMSVIWLRTRDSKGLQWVHGYQAMKVLKAILLHGPLAAVAHATDGMQTIRMLAFRKAQGCEQIQSEALEIYNLLSDRSRLFLRRRVAGETRRKHCEPEESPLVRDTRLNLESPFKDMHAAMNPNARPPEPQKRRASLSTRRASLSSRLPHRLSISKHIMALEPMDENSINSFTNVLPIEKRANRHNEFLNDTFHRAGESSVAGSLTGDLASARRFVREVARKTAEEEKKRTRDASRKRDSNEMGVELLKKQFMLLKVAIYLGPIFYIFGNHEHFLTIVMFVWLSQQFQVFRAPVDSGSY